MRLIDREPHWVTLQGWSADDPFYVGVSFLCPHCPFERCPTCGTAKGRRIVASFWPPIDPANWLPRISLRQSDKFHTRVSGETFDTLTLRPSVRIEGHWHGTIENGELKPA